MQEPSVCPLGTYSPEGSGFLFALQSGNLPGPALPDQMQNLPRWSRLPAGFGNSSQVQTQHLQELGPNLQLLLAPLLPAFRGPILLLGLPTWPQLPEPLALPKALPTGHLLRQRTWLLTLRALPWNYWTHHLCARRLPAEPRLQLRS